MQQERIPKEQIQKDIKNGVCKVIDGFFVYSDKVVQYTSHFGYTINRGTLCKGNGMVISRATDKKRFSVARLIAKAFLVDQETDDFFVVYKDGNKQNCYINNLEVQYKSKEKYCKICGKELGRNNKTNVCLDCRRKNDDILATEEEILVRNEKFKYANLDDVSQTTLDKLHLYLQGYTYQYIANKYGVSRQAIEYALKRLLDKNRRKYNKKDNKELITRLQKAIETKQEEIGKLSYQVIEKQKEMNKLIRKQNALINQ